MKRSQWLILIEEDRAVVSWLGPDGILFLGEEKTWQKEKGLVKILSSGVRQLIKTEEEAGETSSVVFALSPFWVDQDAKVFPSRKKILKKVCERFSLTPHGFLTGEEVWTRFYSSAISIYLGNTYLRVSVFKDKKLELREEVEFDGVFSSETLTLFLEKLKNIGGFPPKILFWGNLSEKNKSEILNIDWEEHDVFESKPKLDFFSWDKFFKYFADLVWDGEKKDYKSDVGSEKNIFGFSSNDAGLEKPVLSIESPIKKTQKIKTKKFKISFSSILVPVFRQVKKIPAKIAHRRVLFLFLVPLVLGSVLGFLWYSMKVRVIVYITPQPVEKEITTDLSKQLEQVTETLEAEKTKSVSGTKLVGDRAVGTVTIYNRTSEKKELLKGESLIGPGDLKFILDNEVSVASKTADLTSGVDRWGEVDATVTAEAIGAKYNLAGKTSFTISGVDEEELLAKNKQSFTSGTSRKIQAVSEDDQKVLKEKLVSELFESGKEKIQSRDLNGEIFGDNFTQEILKEKYSAEVGDEVDELSLVLEMKVSTSLLSNEDVVRLAEKEFSGEINDGGYGLDSGSVKLVTDEDEKLKLSADLVTVINKQELTQKIVKKKLSQVKKTIRSYPRVYRVEIIGQPGFVLKIIPVLPSSPDNIEITLSK